MRTVIWLRHHAIAIGANLLAVAALLPGGAGATEPGAPPPNAVARIGNDLIFLNDLGPATADSLAKIGKSYARRRAELEAAERTARQDTLMKASTDLLNQRVLALEAASTHQTREALLAGVHGQPTTAIELRRIYDEHAKEIQKPYAEVETELRGAIEQSRTPRCWSSPYGSLSRRPAPGRGRRTRRSPSSCSRTSNARSARRSCLPCGQHSPAIRRPSPWCTGICP